MKLQEALPEFNEDLQNDSMGGQIILRRHGEMPLEVLDQSKLFPLLERENFSYKKLQISKFQYQVNCC